MTETERIHQIYEEVYAGQIIQELAILKHRQPTEEEIKAVVRTYEVDIEQENFKYKWHLLFCTRWMRNGLGFFKTHEDEPFRVFNLKRDGPQQPGEGIGQVG